MARRENTTNTDRVDDTTTADRDVVVEREVVTDRGAHVDPGATVVSDRAVRDEVVIRERERFGGMKFGSGFFGWLTAAGTGAILTAVVSAAGAAIGFGVLDNTTADEDAAETIGIVGVILLALVIFVAYLAGGYVAGRMARFSGAKQGVAVWLWSIIMAIVAAVIGLIAGAQFDVLARLNGLPRLPINEGDLTVTGIVTAVLALLIALAGAVLGGLAGMRYHRRVDRVGLEPGNTV
jgi:MFS family permease